MPYFVPAPDATADIDAIADTIAADNPAAAVRWLVELTQLFLLLATHPLIGQGLRTKRFGKIRRISHGIYLVYYRPIEDGVEILRVIHGARDQETFV